MEGKGFPLHKRVGGEQYKFSYLKPEYSCDTNEEHRILLKTHF